MGRVVKDFMVQGGDFSDGNGKGGESVYGGMFQDENFELKHDQPFLLSMANKGPNTNGSQFFILTSAAPHLDNIHTVFGHVISGKEVIKEVEQLQVDKKNRPLQDARVIKSGELVPKAKKKESSSEESSEDSSSDEEEKIRKKLKKEKKKAKKLKKKNKKEMEEGEIEEAHPLVQLTNIDPAEIPDIPSNRFLDRNPGAQEEKRVDDAKRTSKSDRKKVRGRGTMMYRRDSRSRSRSRNRSRSRSRSRSRGRRRERTPDHWRQEERRTVSLKEYEKMKKEKIRREEEREQREEERKERDRRKKAEEEKKELERMLEKESQNKKAEEIRKSRKFREEKDANTEGMDYDKLDFDPEDDDETMLRLKALETQARNLIPNYGSPPKPRSSSEDSSHQPTTSKAGKNTVSDNESDEDEEDKDIKRRRRKDKSPSPSPLKRKKKKKSRSRSRRKSRERKRSRSGRKKKKHSRSRSRDKKSKKKRTRSGSSSSRSRSRSKRGGRRESRSESR